MKLSDYVMEFIARLGVEHVFLLPGGGCMHLVDSLGRCTKLTPVCCLHEQAAAIAADAYAQYTNQLGVCLVTTGPGGTNAITGVAGSWIDSIPVLVISGQVKRNDMMKGRGVRQMGIQEVDIISLVTSITKYAVTVTEPDEIRYHLEKGVFLAQSGRPGPVWIDIPLDIQAAHIDENTLESFTPPESERLEERERIRKQARRTLQLLNDSERPVILAGNGVRLGKAREDFLKLIDRLRIPVLTTWKSIDFLADDHPLFFGRPGSIAQRGANFIQQNCDWIAVIGARLDLAQIGYNYDLFARCAAKVVVDVDQSEIDKLNMSIDLPVCADAKHFLEALLEESDHFAVRDRSAWLERCLQWKNNYPVILPEYREPATFANTYHFIDVLSKLLSGDDVLVPGSSGTCSEITLQAFRVKAGQRILNNPGLGAMGFGLPASIGACLASGRKRTVTIIGDGGLQHNIQELETVARLKLPLKIFVLNNNGYASIRATHTRFFDGRLVCCDSSSGLTLPETGDIARAYKLSFIRIENNAELTEKVPQALETDGPVVCEILIDPEMATSPKLSSEIKPDGRIVSKPLEDLWPFLDRAEFHANMIIPPVSE